MANLYRRVGTVTATVLTEPRLWVSDTGDALESRPGDYWVVDAAGTARGVAKERFGELYEPLPETGHYRRRGTVQARRATCSEMIDTLEGPAAVSPGMWVITDSHGDSWATTHDYFRDHYLPIHTLWAGTQPTDLPLDTPRDARPCDKPLREPRGL